MKILIPILLMSFSACGQANKTKTIDKSSISLDSIKSVFLKQNLYGKDSIELTNEEIKAFANSWNQAEYVGFYKYIPQYWLTINIKNGEKRIFRINKQLIKEDGDMTFALGDSLLVSSFWKSRKAVFPKPEQYTPLSFIKIASNKIKDNSSFIMMSMVNKFPNDWVKEEDIDSLITIINSTDSCACFLNPLSSFIPDGYAEKGGYAAIFIKAFKEDKSVDLGLYSCPKMDPELNKELLQWWDRYKKE